MNVDVKYNEQGLVPAIVTDADTSEVLMMAWMNEEALQKTIRTKKAHYYSRSRKALWMKGETSGHVQTVRSIKIDCDGDTVLLDVEQTGEACHTGHKSCFYRDLIDPSKDEAPISEDQDELYGASILKELYSIVKGRKQKPKEGSYTNYLFDKGQDKILKKVGEETAEVIIAAKNDSSDELIYETSDLLYHLIVLLVEKELTLEQIYGELKSRR